MPLELPLRSDGPERFHGGAKCPQHHEGVRTGLTDWCCCCNPCLYERQSNFHTNSCCRCVPQMLCVVYTPTSGSACCRTIVSPAVASHGDTGEVQYTGSVVGVTVVAEILPADDYLPCRWRIQSDDLGIDETYEIDNYDVTCLSVPSFSVDGVYGAFDCVGTISLENYEADKVLFVNRSLDDDQFDDLPIDPYNYIEQPCLGCETAARVLCVTGKRHADDPDGFVESVEFIWDEDLNRWQYLPECGDPSTDRELIFLRGDDDGNCYLEFDFEQTGPWTNDWADPPNSTSDGPANEREGLALVNSCACGLRVQSETTSGRWVDIHAGPCGRWKYVCGDCRCAPSNVCVIGEIDDTVVDVTAEWDGEGWSFAGGGGVPAFYLRLVEADCLGNFGTTDSSACAISVEGDFSVPFLKSDAIDCGKYMTAEISADYSDVVDPPATYNWLWITASNCGCNVTSCGLCEAERCGGAPKTLYAELQAESDPSLHPEDPYAVIEYCNLTVPMKYWARWDITSTPILTCGYIGHAVQPEDGSVIRVQYFFTGGILQIDRKFFGSSTWNIIDSTLTFPPIISCDPFEADMDWIGLSYTPCPWGSVLIDKYKITVVE